VASENKIHQSFLNNKLPKRTEASIILNILNKISTNYYSLPECTYWVKVGAALGNVFYELAFSLRRLDIFYSQPPSTD
jgi:hypothetical protein